MDMGTSPLQSGDVLEHSERLSARGSRTRVHVLVVIAATACLGCSSSIDGSNDTSSTTSAVDQAVTTTSLARQVVVTSTEPPLADDTTTTKFVDTNGTDPNPELSRPIPAFWTVDPAAPPTPESTLLHLLVTERACASGIAPTGRIEASVEYTTTEVIVSVIVNTVGGTSTAKESDRSRSPCNSPNRSAIERSLARPRLDSVVLRRCSGRSTVRGASLVFAP